MKKVENMAVETKDDVEYYLHPVKWHSKDVGFAPVKVRKDLDDLLEDYTKEQVFELATTQLFTRARNAVAGKFNKDGFTASDVGAAFLAGELTPELIAEAQELRKRGQYEQYHEAIAHVLGRDEKAKPNPNKIHWDCGR